MSSTIEPEGDGQQFVSDDELKSLLDRWIAPEPSKSLDQRVANSYYTEMGNVVNAAADSIRFPQSQKEVVAMKFCSTCQEEFADRFSFCPVDGMPLNGLSPRLRDKVTGALRAVPSRGNRRFPGGIQAAHAAGARSIGYAA